MTVELSVVVVSWNTRDALARSLASIRRDPAGAHAELWVVDNASSDGSAELVRRRFPDARLIANASNRGFAVACNQALSEASGWAVALVNSDATVERGALAALLSVLQRRPDVAVVGGLLLGLDGRPRRSYGAIPTPGAFVTEMLGLSGLPVLRRLLPAVASPPRRRERAREVGYVSGACLAFRRELLSEIGLLDERFFLYFEETDFCARARETGRLVWFEPSARVSHEGQASAAQPGSGAAEHYVRSAYAFVAKHHGPGAARRLRTAFLVWLWLHSAAHRLQALARQPGAQAVLARKRRLRSLHRSLAVPGDREPCPCGHGLARPERIGAAPGLRCEQCGLLARSVMPAAEQLDRWYREDYWAHDAVEQLGPGRANLHRHVLEALASVDADPDVLVDVGCGAGGLLALCRERGWRGIGFEVSLHAVAHARSEGLEIHVRPWPSSGLPDEAAGAVTFVNTLDHLRDPFSALREAWRVLRPGGLLYVRVPNGPLHLRQMRLLSAVGLDELPVFHLFGFGGRALRHHLPRLGFRVVVLRTGPPTSVGAHGGASRLRTCVAGANRLLYRALAAAGLDRRVLGTSIEVIAVKDPDLARGAATEGGLGVYGLPRGVGGERSAA